MSRQLVLIPSYRYRRQMMLGCASYFVHLMPGWLSAPFAHQVGVTMLGEGIHVSFWPFATFVPKVIEVVEL
jgi:hypothetical protein